MYEYTFYMKVVRIITVFTLISCAVFTAFVGSKKLMTSEKVSKVEEYKGIITIWNIDIFEGGTGSRKQFLLKVARGFEKKNKGVLVMVISHTKHSVEQAIDEGDFPDIISFGGGVNVKGLNQINLDRVLKNGYVGAKKYATTWAQGNYFLISNPNLVSDFPSLLPSLLVSQNEYTQPLTALYCENIKAQSIEILKPMDAYVKFVSGKTPYFLATQRDVIRLKNRGMEVDAKPLTQFNDLHQYAVVTSTDKIKQKMAEMFLEYLTCDSVQKKLNEIGMFSPFVQVEYLEGHMSKVENFRVQHTLCAFTGDVELKNLQSLALLALNGDQTSENKIKNMLLKS